MLRPEILAVPARDESVALERGRREEVAGFGSRVHAELARDFVLGVAGGLELVQVGARPGMLAHPEGEADQRGYVEAGVIDVELRFER